MQYIYATTSILIGRIATSRSVEGMERRNRVTIQGLSCEHIAWLTQVAETCRTLGHQRSRHILSMYVAASDKHHTCHLASHNSAELSASTCLSPISTLPPPILLYCFLTSSGYTGEHCCWPLLHPHALRVTTNTDRPALGWGGLSSISSSPLRQLPKPLINR